MMNALITFHSNRKILVQDVDKVKVYKVNRANSLDYEKKDFPSFFIDNGYTYTVTGKSTASFKSIDVESVTFE